jgi:hypothetical protein
MPNVSSVSGTAEVPTLTLGRWRALAFDDEIALAVANPH